MNKTENSFPKTEKELLERYPKDWNGMTDDEAKSFIDDSFSMYESFGYRDTYACSGSDFAKYNGHTFKVIRRCSSEDADMECLPMWDIEFDDGTQTSAFPEEIINIPKTDFDLDAVNPINAEREIGNILQMLDERLTNDYKVNGEHDNMFYIRSRKTGNEYTIKVEEMA